MVLRMAADPSNTHSISVRLQRTTTEEAYLSIPVDGAIMQEEPVADGSFRIDPDKLWAEAIRLAKQSAEWVVEDSQVAPHPIQQAPPWVAGQLRKQGRGEWSWTSTPTVADLSRVGRIGRAGAARPRVSSRRPGRRCAPGW
jgi:hypothetical protein